MGHNKIVTYCNFCENHRVINNIRQISMNLFLYDRETGEICLFPKFCSFHKDTDDF